MEIPTHPSSARVRTLGCYLAALGVCLLVLGAVFDLRAETRKSPFAYQGDTMFYHLMAKSITDGGWFLDVPLLGAPGGLNLRDVPTSDNNLHALMLWLLARRTSDYPVVLNNFFLLSFPLVFLPALLVMRHFGVGWPVSVCGALLYAFAPFHFTRGQHHLFLSAYWPVPLAVLMMLWVSRDGLWPKHAGHLAWRSGRLWSSLLICLVLASTGFYYAFFAGFFVFVAGMVAALRDRSWRRVWPALGLIVVIGAGLAGNLWPSLAHFREAGTAVPARRQASEADEYALRIAQLLLPVNGHRLAAFEGLKNEYNRRALINENAHASLGCAGALGFLGLVWWFFVRKPSVEGWHEPGSQGLLHHLSIFNLAGLLLGTMGGFGSLVAFFGFPQVRGYNRISVFLSFFALFALALWLDDLLHRHASSWRRRGMACLALAAATLLALADQVSPRMLPDYERVATQFASDEAFVREIEVRMPRGAQIFQLPFMPFPEGWPASSRMRDYDLLRGYLHSDHLRWSYGTVRGREANAWLRQTAAKPADQLLETLIWAGFSGVYIDRYGFDEGGEWVERGLYAVLQEPPVESPDRRLAFYDLTRYRASVERDTPRGEWAAKREAALHPPLTVWRDGFYDLEGTSDHTWRWARSTAWMELVNGQTRARDVRLDMTLVGNDGGNVTIQTRLLREPIRVSVTRNGQKVDRMLVLPPGRHRVQFSSDAPPVYPPDDFRDLVFSVQNFELAPLAP
jgi:phosphoglycerol transferase